MEPDSYRVARPVLFIQPFSCETPHLICENGTEAASIAFFSASLALFSITLAFRNASLAVFSSFLAISPSALPFSPTSLAFPHTFSGKFSYYKSDSFYFFDFNASPILAFKVFCISGI